MNARRIRHLALVCATLAASAAAQAWESIGAPWHGVAAYDPDRDRIVHVGIDRRVHEWHFGAWFARPTQAPGLGQTAFIDDMHMVHDPVQHRMLLLGNSGGAFSQRTLFAYDGEEWSPRSLPTLPSATTARTIAFDLARARLVLLAGAATYEFDGQTWTRTVATGTPNIDSLAFDPQQQRLMAYGSDATGTIAMVSTYDGVAWSSTTVGVPPYRIGATLAFDPIAGAMVLHGSTDVFSLFPDADDWEWNGAQWRRIVGTGTFVTYADSLASTPSGLLRIEQAWGFQSLRRVSLRTAPTWTQLGSPASPAFVQQLVADPAHGGIFAANWPDSGTEVWRLANRDWVLNATLPGTITSVAFDPVRQVVVGMDLWSTANASEWTWNGTAWNALPFAGAMPPFRAGSTSAFDAARNEFLVFGGQDYATQNNTGDLWTYGNGTWTLHAAHPAMPLRIGAGMVHDPVLQRTLVVGGVPNTGALLDDTWSWNGTTWQRLSPLHAPFSGPTALVFDPVSQQPLAINQVTSDTLGVFAHDGTNWNLLSTHPRALPLPNQGWIEAAIEPGTGRIVVTLDKTTLRLSPHPAAVEQQGAGCGTSLRLSARTFARVGEVDAGIDLRGVPGGALLGLSLQSANVALGGGCALQLGNLDLTLVLGVNAAGFGSVTLPVPNAPALAGLTVFAQAAQLDPTSPIGIAVSGRLAITIGE